MVRSAIDQVRRSVALWVRNIIHIRTFSFGVMSTPVITLIGGPTALIEANGFRLLTDPTFDAPGEYQLPHVTLKKLSGPARTAAQVGQVEPYSSATTSTPIISIAPVRLTPWLLPAYLRRSPERNDLAPRPKDWRRGKARRSASRTGQRCE